MKDDEFTALCEAHSFGAVARNEFAMIPRAMLKDLVDAGVAAERERLAKWYATSGWLLDEEDVSDAMRKA